MHGVYSRTFIIGDSMTTSFPSLQPLATELVNMSFATMSVAAIIRELNSEVFAKICKKKGFFLTKRLCITAICIDTILRNMLYMVLRWYHEEVLDDGK